MENIEKFNYRQALGNSTIGIGNTRIWDFEYQAFILAYRRSLDYLARAIATYFRNDFHSFRTLGDFLLNQKPEQVSQPLITLHTKFSPLFEFVISEGTRKSVRDKISHYEYVPVGAINLSRKGFVLMGGGEQLGLDQNKGNMLLSEVLDTHMLNLRMCIREMMYCFVDSIKVVES